MIDDNDRALIRHKDAEIVPLPQRSTTKIVAKIERRDRVDLSIQDGDRRGVSANRGEWKTAAALRSSSLPSQGDFLNNFSIIYRNCVALL